VRTPRKKVVRTAIRLLGEEPGLLDRLPSGSGSDLSEVAKRLREHEERVRKYAKEARLGDLVGVSLEEEFE
jgi:hypothetical protein